MSRSRRILAKNEATHGAYDVAACPGPPASITKGSVAGVRASAGMTATRILMRRPDETVRFSETEIDAHCAASAKPSSRHVDSALAGDACGDSRQPAAGRTAARSVAKAVTAGPTRRGNLRTRI